MKLILAAAFLCLAAVAPAWADPSGTYKVSGINLDGTTKYDGSVTLTQTGDTFKVVWTFGDTTVTGTAIGNDDVLSVGYASGTNSGVALFTSKDGNWEGVWSYLGQTKLGSEQWSK
jgi:hypothetical protein